MDFRKPTIEDKELIDSYLNKVDYKGCEFTFANMFLWSKHYEGSFCIEKDMLLFKSSDTSPSFVFPLGDGDVKTAMDDMMKFCVENNFEFKMHNLSNEMVEILNEMYPNKFEFTADRDTFDYIYSSEDLIELKGKKYHSKRNHINKFMENDWCYETITQENIQDCLAMNQKWCELNGCGEDESKLAEMCVVKNSFKHFERLGLKGGLIRLDGQVVAFALGEPVTSDTFVVHIEKAFSDIQGAYPIINREFAAHEILEYKYINREEDLGVEGLRKAKLSYKPAFLLEKFTLKLK